jgi:hypothetical protein
MVFWFAIDFQIGQIIDKTIICIKFIKLSIFFESLSIFKTRPSAYIYRTNY